MGTFSAFTCTLPLPLADLTPWEAAYYARAPRGRLHGLGGDPTREALACWMKEAHGYEVNIGRYGAEEREAVFGGPRAIWLGTLICPKPDPWGRHQLYDAMMWFPVFYGQNKKTPVPTSEPPGPVGLFMAGGQYKKSPALKGNAVFEGDLSQPSKSGRPGDPWDGYSSTLFAADKKRLIRVHSPNGIAHKGIGAGAVLYAASALAAIHRGFRGVYSIEGTRSNSAAALWASTRDKRSGPLAERFLAPIELGNPNASVQLGYRDHCLDENLVKQQGIAMSADVSCPVTNVLCSTNDATRRVGNLNVDFITEDGLARWGLVAFRSNNPEAHGALPKWGPTDVTKVFGKGAKPSDARALARMLSPVGAELLARASIGASPGLIAKVAAVLYGTSPDLAHAFLTREDIVAVLSATPAGRKLVQDSGQGGTLAGMGRAILRDVEASMYRPADPLSLTLPPLSKSAQTFVNTYPGE